MSFKKHGNAFSVADEKDEEDFFTAAECVQELLEEFNSVGLREAPALGGALTQMLTHLIINSPDTQTAMGLLSMCLSNAAIKAEPTVFEISPSKKFH